MRLLSILLLVTLSYVTCATIESTNRICIQGGDVPIECPNNYKWNSYTCKFECKPHCVSNEGLFIFAPSNGTKIYQQCNSCTCKSDGTATTCTKKLCLANTCYDDAGNAYTKDAIITSGCRTGKCTIVNGQGVWSWYSPASASVKPNCPYGPGIFNNATCKWECPRTCQDGSTPRKCANGGLPPCSVVRCGFNTECTDNYCPNYPNNNRGACTATCVSPALCAKDPCQTTPEKPKCGKTQKCQADYRFGCGYQCQDITCVDNNDQIYQVGETRPSEDGCNTCTCRDNGDWICTERACSKPTTNDRICAQGGPVPAECPNNNRWNSVTCKFECVCSQNRNCGFNGVWDYDQCTCVVNTPATPTCSPPQAPRCDFAPAVLNTTSCKYFCPSTCTDGSSPFACLINPCASTLCAANTQCHANYCGGCNAECKPIETTVQCLIQPCQVNSCANGQTCVNDYA